MRQCERGTCWRYTRVAVVVFALLVAPAVSGRGAQQDANIDEARREDALFQQLFSAGQFRDALPHALRALAIREKALGATHPSTAISLSNLAELYRLLGAYSQAEPLYLRALTIVEKVLGPTDPDTAIVLNNLAELYRATGAYARAEPLYQRALAIVEKALGPEHPDTAGSLNNLALLYWATGAYAQAEPLHQRALAIREKTLGPAHPHTANSLSNLALVYQATGAYEKAEPLYRRALTIRERALGPAHPDTALSLNNLAALYQATGAYAQAEPLYQRALTIREQTLGPTHPDTAQSLNNLALLYGATGAYAQAEPLYRRALAIREQALGPAHPDTAQSLNNLAAHYLTTGAYAQAEPLYRRALTIREKALGPTHPDIAQSLTNLALLYWATGAYAQAEPLYQRALAIDEKTLGAGHPETAASLNNLALLYWATGAYAQAEPLYQRALAVVENALGAGHPHVATSLANLAGLYLATGASARAGPLYERSLSIAERNSARFLLTGGEARKRAYLQQRSTDVYQDVTFSLAHGDVRARGLGLTAVLQYKGRVLDAMTDNRAQLRRSVAPGDRALFEKLVAVTAQLSTLTFRGPGTLSVPTYRAQLDALARQEEQLQADLSGRSAALRPALTPVTLEAVRNALPPDRVLVEWFRYAPFNAKAKDVQSRWGSPRYVAFVLRRDADPAAIDLGPAEDIERPVHDFRAALRTPTSTFYAPVARDLYDKLVAPLRTALGRSERLLLSPDGALNLVPFAALMDETGQYLAQRFELSYLTSGRDLVSLATAVPARTGALVVADPAYGLRSSTGPSADIRQSADLDFSGLVFQPLPGTAAEAEALQGLLKLQRQEVLTGEHATEDTLKAVQGPRLLHVATHGFFLNDPELPAARLSPAGFGADTLEPQLGTNPLLRSGLALAGANARRSGQSNDGILTAAEAAELDLVGTQLVVLSACQTGEGQVQQGEGVYGLRRALVLAGAQAQLVSLWTVSDAQTKDLMVDYYRRLLKGEGRSAALRQTQLQMIGNPASAHPFFWAAFVPIGAWGPLAAGR